MFHQSPFVPVFKLRLLGSLVTDFPRVQQLHTLKAYSKPRGTLYVMCTRFRWAVTFKLRPPHAIRGMRGLDGPAGRNGQTVAPLPFYGLLHIKMWVQILQGATGPLTGWLTPSAKQLSYHNLAEVTKRTTPPEPKICVILKKLNELLIFTNHFSVSMNMSMNRLGHRATPAPQPFSDVLLVPT
jgi:hypothetical protein